MSREFPDFVDPWKAADGNRVFHGTMPLKWMRRLAPLLVPARPDSRESGSAGSDDDMVPAWPDASFEARFGYDEQDTVTVDLEVEAELPLLCQRSMRPYRERVRRRSLLALVDDIAGQDGLPECYEPVLVEQGRVALLDLVEEELLLAVPQVPRNPEVGEVLLATDGEPGRVQDGAGDAGEEQLRRPFEGLAELLKKRAGAD